MKTSLKTILALIAVVSAPAFARGPVIGGISLDMTPKQIRAAIISQGRSMGETKSTTMYSHEVGTINILKDEAYIFEDGTIRDAIFYTMDGSLLRYEKEIYFRSNRPLAEVAKQITDKIGAPYRSSPEPYSYSSKSPITGTTTTFKGYALDWAGKLGGEAVAPREFAYDSCDQTSYKFGAICDWHFSVSINRQDGSNIVQVTYRLIDAANEYLVHKNAALRKGIGPGAKEFDPASLVK